MHAWTLGRLADDHLTQRRAEADRHRRAASRRRRPAVGAWCGYRLIGLGCRLARSDLVAASVEAGVGMARTGAARRRSAAA